MLINSLNNGNDTGFQTFDFLAQTWQQQVDSDIRVTLDDVRHELHGDIHITYRNNSPETLDFVWMHLWPNAYRNGKTALAKQQFRDGDALTVDA